MNRRQSDRDEPRWLVWLRSAFAGVFIGVLVVGVVLACLFDRETGRDENDPGED